MPVSSREARGHFEIITSSSERLARLAASRNSTSDDTSFVDFIENMAIGQEIVAKPGSTKFAYVGRHEITHFRCFVAEVRALYDRHKGRMGAEWAARRDKLYLEDEKTPSKKRD